MNAPGAAAAGFFFLAAVSGIVAATAAITTIDTMSFLMGESYHSRVKADTWGRRFRLPTLIAKRLDHWNIACTYVLR